MIIWLKYYLIIEHKYRYIWFIETDSHILYIHILIKYILGITCI